MIIEPDPVEAGREQALMVTALGELLRRHPGDTHPSTLEVDPRHPAVFAVGWRARTGRPAGEPPDPAVLVALVAAHRRRSAASGCPAWALDLAEPEPHLVEALDRAAGQAPSIPGRGRPDVHVASWRPEDRARWCASVCLLARAWPALLAELRVTVRQLALIGGRGVGGFAADFGAHGAVFINRRRLDDGEGMPSGIRYAEHLAHESTHVRLHAAAGADPFLVEPGDHSVLVATPLRDDPRPLNGLFQQFVVLTRCRVLFDRVLGSAELRPEEHEPARARRALLHEQAGQTAALLADHREALTDRGRAVLDEAGAIAAR